jgi:energy-coupling factor transport system ATP-binding protein
MSISVEGLSHIYLAGTPGEKVALRDITIHLEEGARLGIAGCSGSGKTTLVRHLCGLLKPSSGKIRVNGLEMVKGNLGDLRRRVGVVFQHPEEQLFEETVFREVAYGLKSRGYQPIDREERVREALKAVGLGEELWEASPFSLSAGERRRVAIAAVLAAAPEVLVLDEPTAGLDPRGRRELLELMDTLHRRGGLTLILVSHNLDDMARLCDRVVVLQDGAVAMAGTTREVLADAPGLERAGLMAPQITRLMMKLKMIFPDMVEGILTVEEARAELHRLLRRFPLKKVA